MGWSVALLNTEWRDFSLQFWPTFCYDVARIIMSHKLVSVVPVEFDSFFLFFVFVLSTHRKRCPVVRMSVFVMFGLFA